MKHNYTCLQITALLLATIWFAISMLYYGRDVLVPVVSAAFVAFLILPIVNWFEQWLGRTSAVITSVTTITVGVLLAVMWLLTFQVIQLYYDIPRIQQSVTEYSNVMQSAISRIFDIEVHEQITRVIQWLADSMGAITQLAFTISTSIVYSIGMLVFFLFYLLFFLLYRQRFLQFILLLVPQHHHSSARDVVFTIQSTLSAYLNGIVTVIAILIVYNTIALYALSVPYFFLWACIGGILYIIPYIGITIASIFPATAVLLLQQDPLRAGLVILVFVINQIIENNLLTPYIVGGQVQINPLFVLLAFFAGGQIWGIAGMILFLPILAAVKVLCDHIPVLYPLGYLLGTEEQYNKE